MAELFSPAHRGLWKRERRKSWESGRGCPLENTHALAEHPPWVRHKPFASAALVVLASGLWGRYHSI